MSAHAASEECQHKPRWRRRLFEAHRCSLPSQAHGPPSLSEDGSPSPESAVPCDGTSRPRLDIDAGR